MCPGCLTTETLATLAPEGPKAALRLILAAFRADRNAAAVNSENRPPRAAIKETIHVQ